MRERKSYVIAACLLVAFEAAHSAPRKSRSPRSPIDPLAAFVTHMRGAGIDTVFVSEQHFQPDNFGVAARVLQGAAAGGRFVFWKEMGSDVGSEEANDAALARGASNALNILRLAQLLQWNSDKESVMAHPDFESFRRALESRNATAVGGFHFTSPGYRSMSDFLRQPGFRVASLGVAHAEAEYAGPGFLRHFRGPRFPLTNEHGLLSLPLEAQRDMVDGFKRSYGIGHPAMSIRPASAWKVFQTPGKVFDDLSRNFAKAGYATAQWTVPGHLNVSILVQDDYVPAMLEFFGDRAIGEVRWWCGESLACPTAPAPKSEL